MTKNNKKTIELFNRKGVKNGLEFGRVLGSARV